MQFTLNGKDKNGFEIRFINDVKVSEILGEIV